MSAPTEKEFERACDDFESARGSREKARVAKAALRLARMASALRMGGCTGSGFAMFAEGSRTEPLKPEGARRLGLWLTDRLDQLFTEDT